MQFDSTVGTSLLDLRSTYSAFNKWCPEWSCCCKTDLRTVFTFCSGILFKLRCRDDSNIFSAWMNALRRYRHRTLLKLLIVFHLKTNKPDHRLKPHLTLAKQVIMRHSNKGLLRPFCIIGSKVLARHSCWWDRRMSQAGSAGFNCESDKDL